MVEKLEYIRNVCENELERCNLDECPACEIFGDFLEVIEEDEKWIIC